MELLKIISFAINCEKEPQEQQVHHLFELTSISLSSSSPLDIGMKVGSPNS